MSKAVQDILTERHRQISVEGWTTEHDDEHGEGGQLSDAAACYAFAATVDDLLSTKLAGFWPWDEEWFKPTDPRRNLVKAGALIIAEIERMDRLPTPPQDREETSK